MIKKETTITQLSVSRAADLLKRDRAHVRGACEVLGIQLQEVGASLVMTGADFELLKSIMTTPKKPRIPAPTLSD